MSDIQRWDHYVSNKNVVLPEATPDGEYVTYADHVAALRACEQRVDRAADEPMKDAYNDGYSLGYDAALDAAWKAVGNVPCATTTHGDDWRDIPGPTVKRDALAAIDALREGTK